MRNKTQKNGRNSCLQCDKCDAASNDIIATIDAAAIRHNVDYLRSMSKTDIMPVLKANAYGHGAIAVSKILRAHGVRMIGTATLGEALMLRKSGDKGRIVAWLYDANGPELGEAIRRNIDIGIVDQTHVPAVCKLAANHAGRVRIHLFVDTGINRAGIPYGESVRAALELSKAPPH